MANHVLSDRARDDFQDMRRWARRVKDGTFARRRRGSGSRRPSSSSIVRIEGLAIASIDAASLNATGSDTDVGDSDIGEWELVPGSTVGAIVLLEWNSSKTKLVSLADSSTGSIVYPGLWRGLLPFRASEEEPVPVVGHFVDFGIGTSDSDSDSDGGTERCFMIDIWDPRAGEDYDIALDMIFQKRPDSTPKWEELGVCVPDSDSDSDS